jgi:curved DNA-binding protein CbpA
MADETYYSILGISETASAAEIKAAYFRMIREVHPDTLANAPSYWQRQAEEKAKEINEAYSVLSNCDKRRSYDAQLASYRGFGTPANGKSTSQSSAPQPSGSSAQGSHSALGHQSTAGSRHQSAQQHRPDPPQNQAPPASPPFANAPAQSSVGVSQPRYGLWASIGILAVLLIVVAVNFSGSADTHFVTGPHASAETISGIRITGSLPAVVVLDGSNESAGDKYRFDGYIHNDSNATISFLRLRIRIFNCPDAEGDDSTPLTQEEQSHCTKMGEDVREVYYELGPGKTARFGNFYFPYRPPHYRWDYEILNIETPSTR